MFWSPDSIRPEEVLPRSSPTWMSFSAVLAYSTVSIGHQWKCRPGSDNLLLGLAETQLDGELVRLHRIDRLEQPERDERKADEAEQRRACVAAARQRLLQPVLAAADDVFEIGRAALRAARAARTLPPGAAAIAAAAPRAAAAALVVPGHESPFGILPG